MVYGYGHHVSYHIFFVVYFLTIFFWSLVLPRRKERALNKRTSSASSADSSFLIPHNNWSDQSSSIGSKISATFKRVTSGNANKTEEGKKSAVSQLDSFLEAQELHSLGVYCWRLYVARSFGNALELIWVLKRLIKEGTCFLQILLPCNTISKFFSKLMDENAVPSDEYSGTSLRVGKRPYESRWKFGWSYNAMWLGVCLFDEACFV